MELRIAQARATQDIDLTFLLKHVNDAKDPITDMILQELQTLARINLNDFFIYQIGQPQQDIENAPYGGARYNVSTLIDNRPFVEFHLDVGGDILVNQTDKVVGKNWLGFCDIAAPTILMISREQQFAEKLHCYTLPREQINTRAKDLIDLLLILQDNDRANMGFQNALERVFRSRKTHSLPAFLSEPPAIWQDRYATMAAECGISQSMKDGFTKISAFYNALQQMKESPR